MRPIRIISLLALAAALGAAGCAAQTAAVDSPSTPTPAAAPAPIPVAAPAAPVAVAKAPVATVPASQRHTAAAPAPAPAAPTPKPASPASPAAPRLFFDTPQAAMRYLADAYNRNDLLALGHVTTPVARVNLVAMRRTAVNLKLVGCTANAARGDYTCAFTHDFPAATHRSGHGQAHFTVAPADRPGWYMTVLEDCD
jgi:hypothetical protein